MARANRHFLPGHIWHITHRCHKKDFLLRFSKDQRQWLNWLFEAKKRYSLCVLNYIVTSNHIHLLVKDTHEGVIAQSMQLIAGRSAQHYNQRKNRQGAYWEDRYHATAIESNEHLFRCMTYIDLNMVRAGRVEHPEQWLHSGYVEIQSPPKRYRIISLALKNIYTEREVFWSESVAVGSKNYINTVQTELGIRASGRKCLRRGLLNIF